MEPIKKKTRKRLTKQVRKLVKKHGSEAVTSIVTSVTAATNAPKDVAPAKQVRQRKKRKPTTTHTSTPAA